MNTLNAIVTMKIRPHSKSAIENEKARARDYYDRRSVTEADVIDAAVIALQRLSVAGRHACYESASLKRKKLNAIYLKGCVA